MLKFSSCGLKHLRPSNFASGIWQQADVGRHRFAAAHLFQSRLLASDSKMSKPKVYVTRADVPEVGLQLLRERYEVSIWPESVPVSRSELLKQVRGKDALFCLLTDNIDQEVLEAAGPSLKVVSTMSVGLDHIDVAAVTSRGIKLGFTPDVLTDAVAELTVALLLATTRRIMEANAQVTNGGWGSWSPGWMCGSGLAGSVVGIVGFGRIGQEVALRLAPFKPASILYTSRVAKPTTAPCNLVSLETLLERSDFVIVTCALVHETRGLFGAEAFERMKPGAVFVNTSRGGVVDQEALLAALQAGQIRGAGLDVTSPEPLPPGHPLLKLDNCLVLPHIGSATTQARADMATLAARNIIAALEGKPMPAQAN